MVWQDAPPTGVSGRAATAVAALPGTGRHRADDARPGAAEPLGGALAVVALAIGGAALVNPTGPGHVGPIDCLMAVGVGVAFLWALRNRAVLRLPYVVPMTGLMLTGLLAALLSVRPTGGLQAVVQEVFLVLWCAAIATVCRTARAVGLLLRVWAGSAILWAGLLILAVVTHQKWLSGVGSVTAGSADLSGVGTGTRARLLFDHPNMAGNYFMIAVFIVVAAGFPRRLWLRVAGILVLAVAVFLTGSNAAMVSLIGGSVLTAFLHVRARRGMVAATAVAGVIAIVLGFGWFAVAVPVISSAQHSNTALVRNSVGRGLRSANARESLFQSQVHIFERGDLLGIGPTVTKTALGSHGAAAVHEAHNDYLGTLVERGPLGLIALIGLVAVAWARLAAFTLRAPPRWLARDLPVPAALAGACLGFALTALTHEILHYRWLWTLLGVVAAVHLLARARTTGEAPGSTEVPSRGG